MKNPTARLATLGIVLLAASAALAGGFEKTVKADSDELVVVNLVGHVEVVRGGDDYEVEVKVRGDDASEDDIQVELEEKGGTTYVRVLFPLDDHKTFIYPELGRGKTQINFRSRDAGESDSFWSRISDALGGRKVTIKGHGRGYEAWADLKIHVPKGGDATVKIGAGDIVAKDVEADLWLDTHSGPVAASGIRGALVCDTGSGTVDVRDCKGEITVDTGSGGVYGSDLEGGKVLVDTGSGSVELERVTCRKLDVDTGSGGVEAMRVKTDAARIDTGSGSVVLELLEMGDGKFLIDTGSGGVDLVLPRDASCRVSCDTGSGGVHVDVPGVDLPGGRHDEAEFTVGGGDARVILDTGSGGIHVKMAS